MSAEDEREKAWQDWLDSDEEPPFSEDHHRYHTPNDPLPDCPNCKYIGWTGDSDRERDCFMAGWNAAIGLADHTASAIEKILGA